MSGDSGVPDSGDGSSSEKSVRGRHAAPEERPGRGRHAAAGPPGPDRPGWVVPDAMSRPDSGRHLPEDQPRSTAPGQPAGQSRQGYGYVPGGSYGVMPSEGPPASQTQAGAGDPTTSALSYGGMPGPSGAYSDSAHSAGPVTATGYGRVAASSSAPAAAPPAGAPTASAPPGQYGLMPGQAATTSPAPVATAQAPSRAPEAPKTVGPPLNPDGASVNPEWWERLGGRLVRTRAFRVLMRIRMVLTWASLLVVGVAVVVSPVARAVLGAWMGCLWIVAVCFWLARSRTVSWGLVSGVLSLSMLWAGATGWFSFQVAAVAGVGVGQPASEVVIAGVVEELGKLAPVCLLAVVAPGRVRRLLVQDWLVLGVACGAGFMAVEETARRLVYIAGDVPAVQLQRAMCPQDPEGVIECLHAHTFGVWPLSDAFPGPVAFAGHAIVTGLVAVSIGLGRHLWWRAGHHHPAIGVVLRCGGVVLPVGVLWVAVVDHMASNAVSTAGGWLPGVAPVVKAWGSTNGEPPWPVVGVTSTLAGTGHGRGWMLLVVLVVAMVLDERVMRLGRQAPAVGGPDGGGARKSQSPGAGRGLPGGAGVPRGLPGGAGVPRGLPGGAVGRWGGDVVGLVTAAGTGVRRLGAALAGAVAARRPGVFFRELVRHRVARDLAARGVLDAGGGRWVASVLGVGLVVAGVWVALSVVPPLVAELDQRLSGLLPMGWFAGILELLGALWESMGPVEKAALALIGTAAVVLSGGTLGLGLGVGLGIATVMDAARPASGFMRDPWGATGRYLATHSDLEMAADAALAAAAFVPGGKAAGAAARGAAKAGRAAKRAKLFARAKAPRGLNPRAGIHYPGLRTPRPAHSDGGPGLWGEGKNYGSPRSQAYEEQVTRVPIEHSYYVNGKEFDGYNGFALVDAKGPGYAGPIKGTWSEEPKSTYKIDLVTGEVKCVKKGLIQVAKEQVEAVRATGTDTPIQWHIAEKDTFDELWDRQVDNEFPAEIELFYTPPK